MSITLSLRNTVCDGTRALAHRLDKFQRWRHRSCFFGRARKAHSRSRARLKLNIIEIPTARKSAPPSDFTERSPFIRSTRVSLLQTQHFGPMQSGSPLNMQNSSASGTTMTFALDPKQLEDEAQWKELPRSIELCPGVIVNMLCPG